MHFVLTAKDKPGALSVRLANRDAHVAWLKGNAATVLVAGPFLDADGGMVGSMLILDCAGQAAAEAFAAGDPYAAAGLFESVEIRPWKWVIGAPAA